MEFCPHCMQPSSGEICGLCGGQINWTAAPGQLPLGTLLRGSRNQTYQIGAALGQGGFGVTYAAMDLNKGRRVAIKEYYPSHCATRTQLNHVLPITGQDQDYHSGRNSFLEEAKMLAAVGVLPSVVTVQDYFEANGTAYLVMEYLDGHPLHQIVTQKGKISAQELLPKLLPLLKDLDTLHKAGMIHRDISPDNLMLMPNGSLKLLDFGSARSTQSNRAMTVLLKAGFSPVEQYHGRGQGAWTDVYALAGTIYYCLTGVVPPTAIDRLDGGNLVAPNVLGAGLTPKQEKALLWGLALQPKSRPQNVEQFRDKLFGQTDTTMRMGNTASDSNERPLVIKKKSTMPKWMPYAASGAAVLIMAIVLIVVLIGRSDKPDTQLNNDEPDEIVNIQTLPLQTRPTQAPTQAPTEAPTEDTTEGTTSGVKSGTSKKGFVFTMNAEETECIITGYTGESTSFLVPNTIDDVPVIAIAANAFAGQEDITRVWVDDNLKEIGDSAFAGCSKLRGFCFNGAGSVTISNSAFDNCPNMRYIFLEKSSKKLEGWDIPDRITTYVEGMETGIGKLDYLTWVDSQGIVYGVTTNDEVVVMDIPPEVKTCTLKTGMIIDDNVLPVKWVYEKALEGVDRNTVIHISGDVLYPSEIYLKAQWKNDGSAEEAAAQHEAASSAAHCWNYSNYVCWKINSDKRESSAVQIQPDKKLMEAAMIRAEERVISDEIWRLDDCKWSTVLDDLEIPYTYAAEWSTTLPRSASSGFIDATSFSTVYDDLPKAYGPLVAEWNKYYTHLSIGLAYDEANDNYKIVCLVIVQE